ncbi:beta strand repeat-containing protein, partial [Zooshikella harenae]
ANGSNPTFTEGGAAGSLFNGTSISTVEAGQTIKGFTFTISNVANGINEAINIDGTAIVLTHGTSGSTAGNSLSYSVTVVGTTATVALTGGTMSTATTQTLIDNMSYQNNSNTPSTSNRVVTLTSVQDSGGTANGGDDTASISVASTVTVVGVNDEPTLTANASNPTFIEDGAAASLFNGTSISTVEAGQNISGLTLTVTNVINGGSEVLNIDGTSIALSHGTNGTTVGNSFNYTVVVVGNTATVSLSGGSISAASAQSLVDSISYQNNSNTPDTSNRVVTLTSIQDTGGTANGGDNTGSLAIASTVTVVGNNDAPTLSANANNPNFVEDGSAVNVFNGTTVSTVESGQNITGLTLTVTNITNISQEIINIDGASVLLVNGTSGSTTINGLNYAVSFSGSTATVVLTGGNLTAAQTQTLVDGITYQNNSQSPNTTPRVVTLTQITDDGGTANGGSDTKNLSVASTIGVTSVNDVPTAMSLSNADLRLSSTTGIVGSLSSTDADIGDTHTYVLVSGVGGDHNGLFVIENNVIKAANTANLSGGIYTIRVKTIDGAGGSYERPFTITVIDDASLNYTQQNGNDIGADNPRTNNEPPTINVVLPREAVAVNNVIDANQRTYSTTLTNIAINTQVPPPLAFSPTYNFYTAIGRGFGISSSTPFGSPSNFGNPPGFNQDTGPADSNDVSSPDDSNDGDDDTRLEPTDSGSPENSDTQNSNQGDSSPSRGDTNNSTFRPSFTEQLQLANNTIKKQALLDALVATLPSDNAEKSELVVD